MFSQNEKSSLTCRVYAETQAILDFFGSRRGEGTENKMFLIIFICKTEPCAIFFLLQMCVLVKSHKIQIKTTEVCSFYPLKCFRVFYNTCTVRLPLPILHVSEKICDRFVMFQLVSLSLFTSTEISHSEFQLQWLWHDIPTGPGPRGLSVLAATWCTDSSSIRWRLLLQSTFTLTFPKGAASIYWKTSSIFTSR